MPVALALRNLRRQFRRSLTSLLSIGFGVTALLVASGFTEALFFEFREATIRSQFGHIQVTRPGFQEKGRSDPWSYVLPAEVAFELSGPSGESGASWKLPDAGSTNLGSAAMEPASWPFFCHFE